MLDKLKAWFKRSETIFWARLQVFVGALGAVFTWLVNSPETNEAIKTLLKPEYVPLYVIVFGALTEYLRRRNSTL